MSFASPSGDGGRGGGGRRRKKKLEPWIGSNSKSVVKNNVRMFFAESLPVVVNGVACCHPGRIALENAGTTDSSERGKMLVVPDLRITALTWETVAHSGPARTPR